MNSKVTIIINRTNIDMKVRKLRYPYILLLQNYFRIVPRCQLY